MSHFGFDPLWDASQRGDGVRINFVRYQEPVRDGNGYLLDDGHLEDKVSLLKLIKVRKR